jgi:hypothetical protein
MLKVAVVALTSAEDPYSEASVLVIDTIRRL